MSTADPPRLRLAELIALLSLGTDLGLGQPMEHIIRECLIALRLAEHLGLSEQERFILYYSGLLAWVGCHTDAYELAKWFGDDQAAKSASYWYDFGRIPSSLLWTLKTIGGERPIAERILSGISFAGEGRQHFAHMLEYHYLATDALAERLSLGAEVRASLGQSFERWDGKGFIGLTGESIALSARLVNLADVVEVYHRTKGTLAAIDVARKRSGTQFDPSLVALFCDCAQSILADLEQPAWEVVIAAEPGLAQPLTDLEVDRALEAIADFVDLKSPWTLGHSRGVADLAAAAARLAGFVEQDAVRLRRAALLHDAGRLGVPNSIWDKASRLTVSEAERVRLHPYLSGRMLAFSPFLAPLGALAIQHHERLDGSGYPRGVTGDAITPLGRILAAADAYQAMTQARPYRPALSPTAAQAALRAEVTAGRLDGDAVRAVLQAAGHRVRLHRDWPAGLTTREVEILRLLARGYSAKGIANQLVISPKTVRNHIEHIYDKTGVSNRAGASAFAMRHQLMIETEPIIPSARATTEK